jgi:putative phosphoesterase
LKKILLISDTHSHLDSKLNKYILACDEVWHAGDIGNESLCDEITKLKPLRAVYGNIDSHSIRLSYPEFNNFICEGVNVLITHIGGNPSKYNAKVLNEIKKIQPKVFICGHSHILKVMYDKVNELLFINPGACGVHGFHKVKTAVMFELENAEIKNLAVIEIGSRSEIN